MTWRNRSSKDWLNALKDHKRLALSDPSYFGVYYLGLRYFPCQNRWTGNFQKKRLFHAAPRDHGKSIVYSFLLPLWEIVRNPGIRIVLVSKTMELSMRFVGAIKREIETNARLNADFGPLKPADPPPVRWNTKQIYCRRERNVREPSVRALNMLGSCTGLRSDLTILDDPIDSSLCQSSTQRRKVRDWFLSELTPILEPEGRQLVIGTRKHFDDLYSHLIANPEYETLIERALLDEETRAVLMPEKWSYERLLQDRRELGTVVFNREKQNEVIDDSTALFPLAWLEAAQAPDLRMAQPPAHYLPEGEDPEELEIYQGVDLAMVADRQRAEQSDSDYSVILTLGVRPDGTRILIDFFRQRGLTPDQLTKAIVRQAKKWQPARITIENNLFQRVYELELIRKSDLPLSGHTTTRKKADLYEGVPSLSVLFENRKILLPTGDDPSREKTSLLIQELHGLGVEKHDDLVMALWLANLGIPLHYREDSYDIPPGDLCVSIPQR